MAQIYLLRDKFKQLVDMARTGLPDGCVGELKAFVKCSLISDYSNKKIEEYITKLDQLNKIEDIILFLVTHRFCGYLNYQLLAKIIKKYGVDEITKEMKEYEELYEAFAKQIRLSSLLTLYLEENGLGLGDVVGFPQIVFIVSKNVSLYTFESIIEHKFLSKRWPYILSKSEESSIKMIYSIFPEDVEVTLALVKQNRKFFQEIGIQISLITLNDPSQVSINHSCT